MAKASKAQKGTLIKVLHHVRRYLPFVGLSVLLAAVSVASTLLIPVYTGDAVDLILGPGQVDFAGLFRLIRLQADTPVDVIHRLGSVGFPASHLFHDFTSLLLCNAWFSLHCKKQID